MNFLGLPPIPWDISHMLEDFIPFSYPSFEKLEESLPDQTGKVYIVTGGTSGIGLEVVKQLVKLNATVYVAARDRQKMDKMHGIKPLLVDFNDLTTIQPALCDFKETRLDGVLHNAGVLYPSKYVETVQGHEAHVGINNLAPLLFQKLLDQKCHTERVVWVGSWMHVYCPKELDLSDLGSAKSTPYPFVRYGCSKAYASVVAYQYGLEAKSCTSISAHPGSIHSDLQRNNSWKLAIDAITADVRYGGMAELTALINTPEAKSGDYVVPFGKIKDLNSVVNELKSNDQGRELYDWMCSQINEYLE